MDSSSVNSILHDPEFVALVRQKRTISLGLCLAVLFLFFLFIFLLAYSPDTLAAPFVGDINMGIPFGIGLILFGWISTGIYVRWANARYDTMVARLRAKTRGNA